MESSVPTGDHMTRETFLETLDFTERAEHLARASGCPPTLLFSGGECTEHPEIVSWIALAMSRGFIPILITNGQWLNDPALKASILRPEWARRIFVR